MRYVPPVKIETSFDFHAMLYVLQAIYALDTARKFTEYCLGRTQIYQERSIVFYQRYVR